MLKLHAASKMYAIPNTAETHVAGKATAYVPIQAKQRCDQRERRWRRLQFRQAQMAHARRDGNVHRCRRVSANRRNMRNSFLYSLWPPRYLVRGAQDCTQPMCMSDLLLLLLLRNITSAYGRFNDMQQLRCMLNRMHNYINTATPEFNTTEFSREGGRRLQ